MTNRVPLVALLLALPLSATAQRNDAYARGGIALPESSLRLLLRNREALGLDAGQVLTIELKESELQLRLKAKLEEQRRRPAGRGGGAEGGAGGPGDQGPGGGGGMGGGGRGAPGMGIQGGVSSEGVTAGLELPGVPGGGPSVTSGAGPGGGAPQGALTEIERLDRSAVEGLRVIFRPEQQARIDRLLALRAEALARRGQRPPAGRPPEGKPAEGAPPPRAP